MVSSFASESTPLLVSSSSPVPPSSILHTHNAHDPQQPQQQHHHHVVILMNGGDELVPPASKKDDPLEDHSSSSRRSRGLGTSFRDWSQRVRTAVGQHTGSIGMLGSISIAVNSITGPAMVNLPATFLKSGIVPTIATLVFVGALCSWSSLHLANAISKMGDSPNHRHGNRNFEQEIEFSQAFQRTFRQHQRTWYWMTQFLFWGCITCLNISAIVDTAQVVDTFVGHHGYYGTGALVLHFYPEHNIINNNNNNSSNSSLLGGVAEWVHWDASVCTADELLDGECLPFAEWEHVPDIALITVGKVLVTLVFLPLALLDLKENAAWQVLAFLILLVTSAQFVVQFAALSGTVSPTATMTTTLTWWGHDWDDLLGVVLFNFPLVLAIPAWLYEREPHVDVATVVQCSTALSVVLYTVLGWMGARALPHVSENMVESMLSGCWGTTLQLGATLFTFAIVGLNIPLFSVLMRLNLMGGTVFDDDNNDNTRPAVAVHCSRTLANVAAVGIPFTVAWLLHGGETVTKLLSYGGVFFTSLVAFILPLVLALQVAKQSGQDNFAARGSIDMVSGGALWWTKKRRSSKTTEDDADDAMKHWEIASLRILLTVTILSVVAAILGNALDS